MFRSTATGEVSRQVNPGIASCSAVWPGPGRPSAWTARITIFRVWVAAAPADPAPTTRPVATVATARARQASLRTGVLPVRCGHREDEAGGRPDAGPRSRSGVELRHDHPHRAGEDFELGRE